VLILKINKKFEPIMVSMNVGYTALFLKSWLKTWAIAFVLAFLASKLLPFVVKRIMKIFIFVEKDA